MKGSNRQILNLISNLAETVEPFSSKKTVEYLHQCGLLNYREIERHVIRREVEKLYNKGMGRCDAMVSVAESMGCSYEKVRALIYQKTKNNYAIRN